MSQSPTARASTPNRLSPRKFSAGRYRIERDLHFEYLPNEVPLPLSPSLSKAKREDDCSPNERRERMFKGLPVNYTDNAKANLAPTVFEHLYSPGYSPCLSPTPGNSPTKSPKTSQSLSFTQSQTMGHTQSTGQTSAGFTLSSTMPSLSPSQLERERLSYLDFTNNLHSMPFGEHLNCSPYRRIYDLVQKQGRAMGRIFLGDGTCVGGCVLLRNGLVLTARHILEGQLLKGTFCIFYGEEAIKYKIFTVIEEQPQMNFVLFALTEEPADTRTRGLTLSRSDDFPRRPCLLHFPRGHPDIHVAVHSLKDDEHRHAWLDAFVDTERGSAGGAYFAATGHLIALHLGSEIVNPLDHRSQEGRRYLLRMADIVEASRYIEKMRPSGSSWATQFASSNIFLSICEDYALATGRAGEKAQKILHDLVVTRPGAVIDRTHFRGNTVSGRDRQFTYFREHFPNELSQTLRLCLGKGSLHRVTRQYCLGDLIHSQLLLPYSVWASTSHSVLNGFTTKAAISGSGGEATKSNRPGEKDMPAIVILQEDAKKLQMNHDEALRLRLVDLCNEGKVKEALELCLQDLCDNDLLNEEPYHHGVVEAIQYMPALSENEQRQLMKKLQRKGGFVKKFQG